MQIIEADGGLLAINAFTVDPARQQELVDTIRDAGDPADIPGLRRMYLLRSRVGRTVINHMPWDDEGAFRRALATDPTIRGTMRKVSAVVENARPGEYEIIPLT
ncbi:MAG TPA: antibiotic biosynthesis monooxygenase [Actinocatenispora sp.]